MGNEEEKVRRVHYSEEFIEFLEQVDARVRVKYLWTIDLVETIKVISTKYIKKLEGCDLYEMRVCVGYNEYRTILFAMDSDNVINATEIYLLNSFLKKSTRDYKRQIEKAKQIMQEVEL